jgi:hypothetical protein
MLLSSYLIMGLEEEDVPGSWPGVEEGRMIPAAAAADQLPSML